MDKALMIVLSSIGNRCGLTVNQVIEEANTNSISERYDMCKGCRMTSCDRCQIAFSQKKKTVN